VTFNVDIRDIEQSGIDQVSNYLKDKVKETAETQQLEYEIDLIGTSAPARLSKIVIDTLVAKAEKRGMNYLKLHSGAVHDTMMLADVTDVAMIFVPSKNGISHSPDEYTSYEDIEDGANLMLEAVIELTQ
jgi:Acetylornithine deacetylase/Succinyl-diaminopimelate desuccinylase and related deacylases